MIIIANYKKIEEVYKNDGFEENHEEPIRQNRITYPDPSATTEKDATQNYVDYLDLAVVILVRANENGQMEFGLIEKPSPAFMTDKNDEFNGMFLEAPAFVLPGKGKLPENIGEILKDHISKMGLTMHRFSDLDTTGTSVCQSFTNQDAYFFVASIDEKEQDKNSNIHWFPMSSLESYINMQRWNDKEINKENLHSTLQTQYPLMLLSEKYKEQLQKIPATEFKLDKPVAKPILIKKDSVIPQGYRFSIEGAWYYPSENDPSTIEYSTFLNAQAKGKEQARAANCLLMAEDLSTIDLRDQFRSPYLEGGYPYKRETSGGLVEKNEPDKKAATRELAEEYGISTDDACPLTGPVAATYLNNEVTVIYQAFTDKAIECKQRFDEGGEFIGNKNISTFEELSNTQKLRNSTLTTKFAIQCAKRELEKQKLGNDNQIKNKTTDDLEL